MSKNYKMQIYWLLGKIYKLISWKIGYILFK